MPDVDTSAAPSPAESAAAAGVLAGGDPSAGGNLPLTPAPAAGSQTALTPAPAPVNPQHSAVGQFFHNTLETLAPKVTAPSMGADGKVSEQPVHLSGGDWARRIIAGALTGAASGGAAASHPGGGGLAGLGAGFLGEREALQQQDATQRANLQRNFANRQASEKAQQEADTAAGEQKLRQAQTAYYTTQNASLGFELARNNAKASEDAVNNFNSFEKIVSSQADNTELGVFPDMNAVVAYRKDHPELVKQIAGNHDSGQLLAVPNLVQGADGSWTYQGVRAAIVHPDMMDRPASEYFGGADKIPPVSYFIPGKMGANGKMEPGTWGAFQPDPNTPMKDVLPWIMKGNADAAKDSLQMHREAVATEGEELSNQIKRNELANPTSADTPEGKKFVEESAASAAKAVDTARGGDFRSRSMAGSYPLALKGDQQAMMNLLTNHIGMTLGMQKGARITREILREAQESAPWLAKVDAKFDKRGFLSGVTLTPEQMGQMMALSTAQRSNAWAQAIEAARQGGVADRLQIPADVRIKVKGPDGSTGTLPGAQVSQALDKGAEIVEQ